MKKNKEVIKLELDYHLSPIESNLDSGKLYSDIKVIDNDKIVRKLNYQIYDLFGSYYEFDSHESGCWFNYNQEQRDKDKMLSLITKLVDRLNVINDGSYIVEDHLSEYYKNLVDNFKFDEVNKILNKYKNKEVVELVLRHMQGPLLVTDYKTGNPLTGVDIIDNDKVIKKLNKQISDLYDSFYLDTSTEITIDYKYIKEKEVENRPKLLSLLKQLNNRLSEINDGSFIVKENLTIPYSMFDGKLYDHISKIKTINLMLDFLHGPIFTMDYETGSLLTYVDAIDNDKILRELNYQIFELYDSYYEFDIENKHLHFNKDRQIKDKDKMLSLIKKLKDRLNEVNDDSFIVNDFISDYYRNL